MARMGCAAGLLAALCSCEPVKHEIGFGNHDTPSQVVYSASFGGGDDVPIRLIRQRSGDQWMVVGTDTHRWDVWHRSGDDSEWVKQPSDVDVPTPISGGGAR